MVLSKYRFMQVQHAPYSSNLAPFDFFPVAKTKTFISMVRFEDVDVLSI